MKRIFIYTLMSCFISGGAAFAQQPWDLQEAKPPVVIRVSPDGNDANSGASDAPFASLVRAQQEVRRHNRTHNVVVELADGVYQLDESLQFRPQDGGQDGYTVTWRGQEGTNPVISGAMSVSEWSLYDEALNIYVADTPKGLNSRQLWINNQMGQRGSVQIERENVSFDESGLTLSGEATDILKRVEDAKYLEINGIQLFTNRVSPVADVEGNRLVMQQPAWKNNIWGYDTIPYPPYFDENNINASIFLTNALAFVDDPGEWFIDPEAGKLYVIPPNGGSMDNVQVDLPELSYLVSISGSETTLIRDLSFEGLRFSYTSWLQPSSPDGYANQQSGAFITGETEGYPKEPLKECSWGCPAFETRRNEWSQIPSAVQVSAAERVSFDRNIFAHLGQVALGVGNDANAHASGVGLSTRGVSVTRNVFYDLSGGAIFAGGIQRDAHHPSDPYMANRDVLIQNNRIQKVSQDYQDNSAILSTYFDSAIIIHNDISDAMYDAIDIGWGWGINDVGGNPIYRMKARSHYDHLENLIYDTPTLHRNVTVAYNRIHGVKKFFHDGGAIYNLSGSEGTRIFENYISNIGDRIAIYLDEGSKGITVRNNVVEDASVWLNVNAVRSAAPLRVTYDNVAINNWFNKGEDNGGWVVGAGDNQMIDNHSVRGDRWPKDAIRVMEAAGIEASAGPVEYGEVR